MSTKATSGWEVTGMRQVPTSMMTQHPDSATRYVSIQEEPEEAVRGLTPAPEGLGLEEIMVDFEGKLTPYHQTAQIAMGLLEKGIVPGRDVHLTPRLPSAAKETPFRQLMALLSVIETNYKVREEADVLAVVEVVVPMVETAEELMAVRRRIEDVIHLAHIEFGFEDDPALIHVIPLIEEVPEQLGAEAMLDAFVSKYEEKGAKADRMRVLLGRSDPALAYGLVAAVLSVKHAISACARVAEAHSMQIHPILGAGALPFRGHVTLENIENTLHEFSGVRTVTVQSGMRYDVGPEATRQVADTLRARLPKGRPRRFDGEEERLLRRIIAVFAKNYLATFPLILKPVVNIADLVPRRRDRLARISAVGYARDLPKPQALLRPGDDPELAAELEALAFEPGVQLPRAITYTAALYSIGLPPEFIGTGRGLAEVARRLGSDALDWFGSVYPSLADDLAFAARFLDLDNASIFLPDEAMEQIREDVSRVTDRFGVEPGPRDPDDRFYRTLMETSRAMLKELAGIGGEPLSDQEIETELVRDWIVKMGKIRGSLG
ncbi:MAG: phosphoenolpyruvate carboxylase [Actinobacteria bacterium]|nr:MAG: phosphoenolpyruvate carboxylase [Actinomycetota bacterium]